MADPNKKNADTFLPCRVPPVTRPGVEPRVGQDQSWETIEQLRMKTLFEPAFITKKA